MVLDTFFVPFHFTKNTRTDGSVGSRYIFIKYCRYFIKLLTEYFVVLDVIKDSEIVLKELKCSSCEISNRKPLTNTGKI